MRTPRKNILLGKGERLITDVVVRSGGGPKDHPYTFEEAQRRLTPMLEQAVEKINGLPPSACPRDEAVISLTLNPEYIAKSYFPNELLTKVGVDVVGSVSKKITPNKRSRGRIPAEILTTEMFARGRRSSLINWSQSLPDWRPNNSAYKMLITLEEISAPDPQKKLKGNFPKSGRGVMEIVLHAPENGIELLADFQFHLEACGVDANLGRRFFVEGLCFLELDAPVESLISIAIFSGVRTLRQMPRLRTLNPIHLPPAETSNSPSIPNGPPLSNNVRTAIFDAGIPESHPLTRWIVPYEWTNMMPATEDYLSHGVAVSSAALFGHIDPDAPLPRPYCMIDHYRVIDDSNGQNSFELYDVLNRIEEILETHDYDFINLSLGPELPISDDEVHSWTSVLDNLFAKKQILAVIAVGNGGNDDRSPGLDRVQVPADCINAISVGACDTAGPGWKRASYSSKGPGRSPGVVKPDMVDFGGEFKEFMVFALNGESTIKGIQGTSFSAPSVMRLATGMRAYFGSGLNHLAIRALLTHTCESGEHGLMEVGWGRAPRSINDIIYCDDESVRVVYQGSISPAKYVRVPIPIPVLEQIKIVTITATICFKSKTDPHHPGNYTRAGLEATFRPHINKFSRESQTHPDSDSFFGLSSKTTEQRLRLDGWKWENCLHATKNKRGSSLQKPCFDVHYNSRLGGRNYKPSESLEFAMIVTVHAKGYINLYDQVIAEHENVLEPFQPLLDLPATV